MLLSRQKQDVVKAFLKYLGNNAIRVLSSDIDLPEPQAQRSFFFRKRLSAIFECIRNARRWTPGAIFRLYTSLELSAESERQATQLWEEGFAFESADMGDVRGIQ